jgi:hypothetical protein
VVEFRFNVEATKEIVPNGALSRFLRAKMPPTTSSWGKYGKVVFNSGCH